MSQKSHNPEGSAIAFSVKFPQFPHVPPTKATVCPPGKLHIVDMFGKPYADITIEAVTCASCKKNQTALAEAEKELERLAEGAPVVVIDNWAISSSPTGVEMTKKEKGLFLLELAKQFLGDETSEVRVEEKPALKQEKGTKWLIHGSRGPVPGWVVEATGIKDKRALKEKYGTVAVFTKGGKLPPSGD